MTKTAEVTTKEVTIKEVTTKPRYVELAEKLTELAKAGDKSTVVAWGAAAPIVEAVTGTDAGMFKQVNDTIGDLSNSAITMAGTGLIPKIEEAKKDGIDPSELTYRARIAIPGGSVAAIVRAESTSRNPRTGETKAVYGRAAVEVNFDAAIDKDNVASFSNRIATLLG